MNLQVFALEPITVLQSRSVFFFSAGKLVAGTSSSGGGDVFSDLHVSFCNGLGRPIHLHELN